MNTSLTTKVKTSIRDVKDFPKEGIVFKDITPVLSDPQLCKEILEYLTVQLKTLQLDAVIGIESRGFLFGMLLAQALNVPFIPVRKKGKLPYKTFSYKYDLEYGTAEVEIHEDALKKGMRVLVHDDLLATGGTAAAASELAKQCQAEIVGFSFLVELEFLNGRKLLEKYSKDIFTIVGY